VPVSFICGGNHERNWAYEYDESRYGCDRMVVEFITTYMQSVPITTNVVSLNPASYGTIRVHVFVYSYDFFRIRHIFHVKYRLVIENICSS
jgi:hypothetical protein